MRVRFPDGPTLNVAEAVRQRVDAAVVSSAPVCPTLADPLRSLDKFSFVVRTFYSCVGIVGSRLESVLRVGRATRSPRWSNESYINQAGWLGNDLIVTHGSTGSDGACVAAQAPDGPPPCGGNLAADPRPR